MKKQRIRVSAQLAEAVRTADRPAYEIAWEADLHPATLSKLLRGAERVGRGDARVLRIAQIVGVPASKAFEDKPRKVTDIA